jgi:hypothetical protein
MSIVQWLLLPAFLHLALVTVIGIRLGRARFRAGRAGVVRVEDIAIDSSRWPDDIRKLSNNFDNQFQIPVLFYAILPLLIILVKVDWVQVALAWAFVASRILHSQIHTGRNEVIRRFQVFLLGFILVVIMWAWFGARLYLIG